MNAVVLTVKASYVASTKYKTLEAKTNMDPPLVIWKMKAPEKQPLVRREAPDEVKAKVKRGSQKKPTSPLKALSDFEGLDFGGDI